MPFPTFDKQEDIPEAFREEYEEVEGTWQLKAQEPPEALREAGQKALREERDKVKAAEAKAKEAERKYRELETAKAAEKAGVPSEELKKIREEAFASAKAELEQEFAEKPLAELPETWTARIEGVGAASENRSLKLDWQAKAQALKNGVRGEKVDDWWKLKSDKFDLSSDGKLIVKDKPATDVGKYIANDLKKETPEFYVGTSANGGGTGGFMKDGRPVVGTTADDVLKNPSQALTAARSAAA